MKFLIDENLDRRITKVLQALHFSAEHIQEIQVGLDDIDILDLAVSKDSIVITFDKDFGELVFNESKIHKGIILLRLEDQGLKNTTRAVKLILKKYKSRLLDNFIVLVEKDGKFKVRIK